MMRPRVIDHLFARLSVQYGARWMRLWEGLPVDEVKASWARDLAAYDTERGHQIIAWALENLPEGPPNAIEFRNLCRRAPMPPAPALPEPKADPERVAQELGKLQALRQTVPADRRSWAAAVVERAEKGQPVSRVALQWARQELARRPAV